MVLPFWTFRVPKLWMPPPPELAVLALTVLPSTVVVPAAW
jgi:hypothetical protein